jgi:hypothetical protein
MYVWRMVTRRADAWNGKREIADVDGVGGGVGAVSSFMGK